MMRKLVGKNLLAMDATREIETGNNDKRSLSELKIFSNSIFLNIRDRNSDRDKKWVCTDK